MDVQAEFGRAIRAASCLRPGDPVLLGVSGGADSLAMLHLFAGWQDDPAIRPYVLHVNHGIRGDEGQADAEFVANTCREWDIPCYIEQADVPALARQHHLTLEEAARQARYRALIGQARRVGARVIAVAHTADDQAETVLMHFLRGSGLAGLRGMLPVTPLIDFIPSETAADQLLLRPLLAIPRAETEAYCAAQHLTPRFDQTNLDTTYFRNRLRREVIPLLESLIPGLRNRLVRSASVLAADDDQIRRDLAAVWPDLALEESPERIVFDLEEWRRLSLSLRRASLRWAFAALGPGLRDIGFITVEQAVSIAQTGPTGVKATLPGGLLLRLGYDALTIAPDEARPPDPDWPLLDPGAEIRLSAPAEVDLACGWSFHLFPYAGPQSGPEWDAVVSDRWSTVLSLPAPERDKLYLRTRRPGDRFQPQGAGGSQKVNAFMINAKIPAVWRGRIPLLAAGNQIAWLCGWRVDERFTVKPDTQEVWLARFERASGRA